MLFPKAPPFSSIRRLEFLFSFGATMTWAIRIDPT